MAAAASQLSESSHSQIRICKKSPDIRRNPPGDFVSFWNQPEWRGIFLYYGTWMGTYPQKRCFCEISAMSDHMHLLVSSAGLDDGSIIKQRYWVCQWWRSEPYLLTALQNSLCTCFNPSGAGIPAVCMAAQCLFCQTLRNRRKDSVYYEHKKIFKESGGCGSRNHLLYYDSFHSIRTGNTRRNS